MCRTSAPTCWDRRDPTCWRKTSRPRFVARRKAIPAAPTRRSTSRPPAINRALALSPRFGLEASAVGGAAAGRLALSVRLAAIAALRPRQPPDGQGQSSGRRVRWPTTAPTPGDHESFIEDTYLDRRSAAWRRIDGDWLSAAEALALDLASDTNNTSLVLAFEWGAPGKGRVLLFAADAQVGNWLSWRDQSYGERREGEGR